MRELQEFADEVVPRTYDHLEAAIAEIVAGALRAGELEEALVTVLEAAPRTLTPGEVDELEQLIPEFDGDLSKRLIREAIAAYRNLAAA